jgi:integrase
MAERIAEIERGDYSRADKSTVAQAAERWLKARKGSIGAKTYNRYEGIVSHYIKPSLGHVQLRKLTPRHIEDALVGWREAVPIGRNGCTGLIADLGDTQLSAMVHFTLLTGLRRGELLALRWEDVDFDQRVVNVHRSLEQLKGGECACKDTKTKKSRRQVPLNVEAIDVLTAHRAGQNAIKLRLPGYNPEGLVFCEPATGLPWGPDRFSRVFSRQMRRLKVSVTFHGLRHTFATMLLRAGVSMKVVSDMLGHETIAITADIYTHVPEAMQREGRPSWLRYRKEGIVSDDLSKRVRRLDSFSLFR